MQKIYFIDGAPGDPPIAPVLADICDADCLIGPNACWSRCVLCRELETPCVAWPHGLDAMADTVLLLRAAAITRRSRCLPQGQQPLQHRGQVKCASKTAIASRRSSSLGSRPFAIFSCEAPNSGRTK